MKSNHEKGKINCYILSKNAVFPLISSPWGQDSFTSPLFFLCITWIYSLEDRFQHINIFRSHEPNTTPTILLLKHQLDYIHVCYCTRHTRQVMLSKNPLQCGQNWRATSTLSVNKIPVAQTTYQQQLENVIQNIPVGLYLSAVSEKENNATIIFNIS